MITTDKLAGKVALVTGGSGDIGTGIARQLAAAGADVYVTYVGFREGAEKVLSDVQGYGRQGGILQLDQRDPDAIEACAKEFAGLSDRLDILVNNAGWNKGIPFPDLEAMDLESWDRIHETNLRGPFLLSRALAPLLKAGDGGHIINIASIGGVAPASSSIAYSASKAGLIHLTRCLAIAMAPDVAVNCISPGLVEDTRLAGNLPQEVIDAAKRGAVLGRVGQIDDIATQALAFVTSTSMTGQNIVIDGGMPTGMK